MAYQLSFYCQYRGISKNDFFFGKFGLKYSEMFRNDIFLHRTSILFIWYAKYHSTTNNAGVVSKNAIFQKLGLKFFKNYFLKISHYFLAEEAKPFHLICKLLFYYKEYFSTVVKKIRIFSLKVRKLKFFK